MRAVTQNRPMAAEMGIRTARIDALTFGLGAGIAGLAGVALSPDRQRLAEPRPGLHHRQLPRRRLRRRRQPLGHLRRRLLARHRQQAARALDRGRPRQDRRSSSSSSSSSRSARAASSRSAAARWRPEMQEGLIDRRTGIFLAHPLRGAGAGAARQPRRRPGQHRPRAELHRRAPRQVPDLRPPRRRPRPRLGLRRHPLARPRRLLRARRLRHGHAPDARDRRPRRLRQRRAPRLHGLPQLHQAPLVLARLRHVLVRLPDGALRPRPPRLRLRLVRLPQPRHRRLPLDHHPGAHLRADARLLPQRDGLRRQQRPHRLQGRPRLRPLLRHDPRRPLRPLRPRARARDPDRPRDHRVEDRQGPRRRPRRREPDPLPRLPRRALQALRLRRLGDARRASPAPSTSRRSASSTRANSPRRTRSRS